MAEAQKGTNVLVQGRMVWGGVKVKGRTQRGSNQPVIDPETGKQVMEYAFGLAIPKQHAGSTQAEIQNLATFWNAIQTEAQKLYPSGVPPKFAWKWKDGDGVKEDGSPYPAEHKGHIVVACTTRIPLKLFSWLSGTIQQVPESDFKCGDYIQVSLNIVGHGPSNGGPAGIYVNPSFVAKVAHGQEIINAPDPVTIFGSTPPPMPVGGSTSPIGTVATPGYASAQFQPPGNFGSAAPTGPAQPNAPAAPHYGVVPQQFQPQPNGQPQGYPSAYPSPGQAAAPQGMPMAGQQMGNPPGMPGYSGAQYPPPGNSQMPAHNAGGAHPPVGGMPAFPQAPNQGAPTMAQQQTPQGMPMMPGVPQYPQY